MIYLDDFLVQQEHFPDGSLHPIIDITCLRGGYHNIDWFYENDAELFTLICVKGWLDDLDPATPVELAMWYAPHARQDRVKKDSDVFTLKYFCKIINSLNFSEVYIEDPHSNVTPALLDRVTVLNPSLAIKHAIVASKAEVIFFPDEGASKRYGNIYDMPATFGVKSRDWDTGRINNLILMNPELVAGKRVLIVDDICSYGSTFVRAAEALRAAGAVSVDLYVTHCEPNITKGGIYTQHPSPIDHIYTTDTLLEKPIAEGGRMEFVDRYRLDAEEDYEEEE